MKIYPMPCIYNENDSFYRFSGNITISYNENFPKKRTLQLLEEFWNNFTGGMSKAEFKKDDTLPLHTLSAGGVKAACEEGYEYSASVTELGFGAAAKDHIGLIHAMMTLLQLIQPERIDNDNLDKFHMSCSEISDKPALEVRSFHISFLPGMLQTVHQTVRMCGLMKYSHLLIEFFGSVKLDSFPEMAFENAYEKSEILPILEEAAALGVELIPMFNCFGHAALADNSVGVHAVLNRDLKYAALYEPDGWSYCLSNPKTLEILKNLRREIIDMCGEGKYFHIGGDEAHSLGTCDVCRKKPIENLYADYINEIVEEMKPMGRRVIMWGDSMLEYDRFANCTDRLGHKYEASTGTQPDGYKALELIDKSVIINDWQYNIWDENVRTSEYFAKKGFDVITASATEVINTDAMCNASKKHGWLGEMQTVWSRNVPPILIARGGSSAWMEDITEYDKYTRGEFWFVRGYMLMSNRSGDLMRKIMPKADYEYSVK